MMLAGFKEKKRKKRKRTSQTSANGCEPPEDAKRACGYESPRMANCLTPPSSFSSVLPGRPRQLRTHIYGCWRRRASLARTCQKAHLPPKSAYLQPRVTSRTVATNQVPKARGWTQSQAHDAASKLFSCLFDPVAF